jgi:hypothetical protein
LLLLLLLLVVLFFTLTQNCRALHALALVVYFGVSLLLIHFYKEAYAGGHSSSAQAQSVLHGKRGHTPTPAQAEAPGPPSKV